MSKNAQIASKGDALRWIAIILLLILGIAGNYWYITEPLSIRIAGWIILVCVMGLVAIRTSKGEVAWRFLKECRNEIRRVVWPNRPEVVRMTGLVFLMVLVLALILWGVDSLFMRIIAWFTGLGG
jgi:preprotein translocase subunit SecE